MFPVLGYTNKTAINIHIQVYVVNMSGHISGRNAQEFDLLGHVVAVCLIFEKLQTAFPEDSTIGLSHQQSRTDPVSPSSP